MNRESMKYLEAEIKKATSYIQLFQNHWVVGIIKGYVVGIQFALSVLAGGTPHSLFEDVDKMLKEQAQ